VPVAVNRIALVYEQPPIKGQVEVVHGRLGQARPAGRLRGGRLEFSLRADQPRLELLIRQASLAPGPGGTRVQARFGQYAAAFFLRDVSSAYPIYVPSAGLAVTEADDARTYEQIAEAIRRRGGRTALQRLAAEPETSYETAAARTRSMTAPIWLGLSRDIGIFQLTQAGGQYWELEIRPQLHGYGQQLEELPKADAGYRLAIGRGISCVRRTRRWLDQGCLPIYHSAVDDGDVRYELTAFVTLPRSPLTMRNVRGTDFLVADGHGHGHMFRPEHQQRFDDLRDGELNTPDQPVLALRLAASNSGDVPRYAFFKPPIPPDWPPPGVGSDLDGRSSQGRYRSSGRVFAFTRLAGRPMREPELSVLLAPGRQAVMESFLPHQPLGRRDAGRLAKLDFDRCLDQGRAFWRAKLDSAGRMELPEPVLDAMVQAGLLHLDLVAYGKEPDEPVTPTIGLYTAIGSESSPIIQFFDSVGWHNLARRSIEFFLRKQRDDGFIQNFGQYMLETGPALWTIGEHYRYTRDRRWARRIKGHVVRACRFMLNWRRRNMRAELRGRGYGLQEGKVADPPDPFHSFMLNGYAHLGMSRAAEMLADIDPPAGRYWARQAKAFKADIRTAFAEAMARSPLVPLGDGTWAPAPPPWAEADGAVTLYAQSGRWYTHGTFLARDAALGAVYLILQEVLEPNEPPADQIMQVVGDLWTVHNVGHSQPYYLRHDIAHLRRGEVGAFLSAYYHGLTSLADRQTYSWWEHYFRASPHKTHEEAWFLMQTRWMLYLEDGPALRLLPGIPRAWLQDGRRIRLDRVASYFGPLSLSVQSRLREGYVEAEVEIPGRRRPRCVLLRLPHPDGAKATRVEGGVYDEAVETVRLEPFGRGAKVRVFF